ncbi:hypothetical protein ABBQ38_001477 [Trebouxia sp. C0009 RCD-2024]
MQGCQVPNARNCQVWAEALDAWIQQRAQEIVHEQTSRALTPAHVQASLQRLLAKDMPTALLECWVRMLVAILFMEEAIRRVLLEFRPDKTPGSEMGCS